MNTTIKKVDTNKDGRVSEEEYKQFWSFQKDKADSKNTITMQESKFKGVYTPKLGSDVAGKGDANTPTDPSVSTLLNLINQLETANDQAKKELIQQQIQNQVAQMESQGKTVPRNLNLSPNPNEANGGKTKGATLPFKAQTVKGGQNGLNPASAKAKTLGLETPKANNFTPSAQWGDFMDEGISSPDAGALLQSTMIKEQYVAQAWDDVNKNTKKGKELMMLFFYYARLAESGDMGAIYQFMKFVTYIISKDKAKQQIEMGKKLIQLQELSRKWTNRLLDVQSNTTDPNASTELMKTMTIVKSETDAIATSQKLISQMMEEFAQVVETLTNTTKGALETQGRILRTVSTFR